MNRRDGPTPSSVFGAPSVRSRFWLSLCVLHAVASMLVWWAGEPLSALFIWRVDDWTRRPWTLWTTAWVHINTPHLIGNQLAVGALAVMAWLVRPSLMSALAWLAAWPLSVLVLPWWPHIGYYAGLSGLIHAAVAVVGVHLVVGELGIPKARRWGGMLLFGLLGKLVVEHAWRQPVVWDDGAGMSIVTAAHLSGTVAGVLWALALSRWVAWPRRSVT